MLKRLAVLDAKIEGSDHLFLPVDFEGRSTRLLLDTGGGWSIMHERLAKELKLTPKKLRTLYYVDVAGGRTTHYVTVPRFTLGKQLTMGESDFLLIRDDGGDPDDYGGTIGAERLSGYDIEIDNATKTVTLYRPDKFCSGRLVRWADKWIEIPYTFNNEVPELRVTVGGERLRGFFDTGSTSTLIDLDVARRLFNVTPASPDVELVGEQALPSGKKLKFYRYTLKRLTVSDLTFENVDVRLGEFEDTPLVLGMREIAQLHLYIASKRKIIYATRIGE